MVALILGSPQVSKMMANQSLIAGVSIRYLLSESFSHLAKQRTGLANPTFNDMKSAFWLCDDPIGHDIRCPRDGRMGCALVDWIPRLDRREQSHFLSWTWQYSLSDLQSALTSFGGSEAHAQCDIFFYVCFFVNNQFRIILESSQAGSEDLETVFESNLKRVGQVVAVLDTWDRPRYLGCCC